MSEFGAVDLIPTIAEPVKVVVDFDHLTVRDDGEFWGGAEPYLLLIFFTLDGNTARLEGTLQVSSLEQDQPEFRLEVLPQPNSPSIVAVSTRGGHGNVGDVNIGPLELSNDGPKRVPITNGTGRFQATLAPIPIRLIADNGDVLLATEVEGLPGFIGACAMLMEEDSLPEDAVQAVLETAAEGIQDILDDLLSQIDLSQLSIDEGEFTDRTKELQDAAALAAAQQMNLWELIWGVIDPDDLLILKLALANVLSLDPKMDVQARYVAEHGDWILVGEIRLDSD